VIAPALPSGPPPLGVPLATDRLAEALADPAITLVTVATPPLSHYPLVMEAISAGRHVVCEKPFARDLGEARAMLQAARGAGVIHMLGAEFRFDAAQALLRRLVQGGAIGKPLYFQRMFYQPGLQDPAETLQPWWEDAAQGGGFLGALGVHMIDQILSMLGLITRVSGLLQTLAPGRPAMTAEDSYNIQFETVGGAQGMIGAGMLPGPFVVGTRVIGTKGGAWIQSGAAYGEPEEVWLRDSDGERRIAVPADLVYPPATPFPHPELLRTGMDRWHALGVDVAPYARLFGEMRRRIAGEAIDALEAAATFADAACGQAVMDAVRRSAAERRWVDIEAV